MATQVVDLVTPGSATHESSALNLPLVRADATTIPSVKFILPVTLTASSTNQSIYAPCDLKVVGVTGIKVGAGGAGDLVQIFNGGTAVSDAIDLHVASKIQVKSSTIDYAAYTFSKGAAITVDPTNATDCSALLFIECLAV